MSQWTHVAGLIRLDSIGVNIVRSPTRIKNEKVKDAVTKALGNTCDYDSEREAWEKCTVPRGSEGSLQYEVYPNSDKDEHTANWGYVAIWGDLRGFGTEDLPNIQDWFEKSLAKLQKPEGFKPPDQMTMYEKVEYMLSVFVIRAAVLSIDVEGTPRLVLLRDNESGKVIRVHA